MRSESVVCDASMHAFGMAYPRPSPAVATVSSMHACVHAMAQTMHLMNDREILLISGNQTKKKRCELHSAIAARCSNKVNHGTDDNNLKVASLLARANVSQPKYNTYPRSN